MWYNIIFLYGVDALHTCLSLTIQTTFAYIHINNVDSKRYLTCAVIGGINGRGEIDRIPYDLNPFVPFLVLSINQFSWFAMVEEFNISAILRICIIFIGMLAVTISKSICHCFWNLVAIILLIFLLGTLRAINKDPRSFRTLATCIWTSIKKQTKSLLTHLN